MSATQLEPDEALTGPLYALAGLLVLIPAADFILSVPSPQPGSVQWRFAAVGLLSGFTLTPILGIAMGLGLAGVMRHAGVARALVILSILGAVLLFVLSAGFILDVLQLRVSVPSEGRLAFESAWKRALVKHLLSAIVLAYLGWRARRMIPSGPREKVKKTVHVVAK